MADRLTLSEAIELAGNLIGYFPNGSPANPRGYIGALAAVLMEYPRQVATACVDPVRGVPRETRFLPTPADVIGWCEAATDVMRKPIVWEDHEAAKARERERLEAEDRRLAEERKARPGYDELKAKAGPNWGLLGMETDAKLADERQRRAEQSRADRMSQVCKEWVREGLEPPTIAGIPISRELAKILKETAPRAEAAE